MSEGRRDIAALVLAAGQGTRMKSRLPKVLHALCGRPMLSYSLSAAESLDPARLMVVVPELGGPVEERFRGRADFVLQSDPRGTGDAVLRCRDALAGFRGDVLVLYGDTPLLRGETLDRMVEHKARTEADLVLLSAAVDVPGIVLRDESGRVARIVEATDATPIELEIDERNTGVYLIDADLLWKQLAQVDDDNAQNEIYLTDIVELVARDRGRVEAIMLEDPEDAIGVNTRIELAEAAECLRWRILNRHMSNGVSVVDPANTYVDADVEIGCDVLIEPGCTIQGRTRIGDGVHIKPGCMVESTEIGDESVIGPSAHLRPDTVLGRGVRIGNFVEVKNSVLGDGVKADHLSYIGDADIGEGASFGCGAIVVNYDGIAKHRTTVGERAFIGCNVNLVAPVEVEADAFVAAGSTITTQVPSEALAVARARQSNIDGWVRKRRGTTRSRRKKKE